ncbi:MAG TPA: isoprenylcysteine carboxylmethyltransferase family protein [Candidatus Baltobacteraceae bacterium]|nr:isoprenylcysteine carboxylmethyltransferase family protein [Candidatus Baltobacteraceae bacterium]
MSWLWLILGLVALQRVAELVYAQRNTERLLANGGVEIGSSHYSLIVLLHAAWLITMAVVIPPYVTPNWWVIGLYVLLQPLRIWTIVTLGPYWTTRVVTVPNAPLIRTGPYRVLRHPNYVVVCAEIAILPLAFGAVDIAIIFSILNAALLSYRIRIEERTLAGRRKTS